MMSFNSNVLHTVTALPATPFATGWRGFGSSSDARTLLRVDPWCKGAARIVKDHLRILEENEHIRMMRLGRRHET
jgi:hypothetical protein